jgi:hypothetical protein
MVPFLILVILGLLVVLLSGWRRNRNLYSMHVAPRKFGPVNEQTNWKRPMKI